MAPRTLKNTSQYDPLALPLDGTEQVEVWRGGKQYQTTLAVLGGNPGPHGESHESGDDKIGTQTPTADAIVRGDDNGQVNDWVADASTSVKGKVQLAENNESAASKAVQANDSRLTNARTPTAHAASHIGGPDDLGLGTSALLDVGVADGVCPLDSTQKVPAANLPSYVDDILDSHVVGATAYALDWLSLTAGGAPLTPETGKIYVVVTVGDYLNKTYRWTGTIYAPAGSDLALGETASTAYRGDRGAIAYTHSQQPGNPHGTGISNMPTLYDALVGALDGTIKLYLTAKGSTTAVIRNDVDTVNSFNIFGMGFFYTKKRYNFTLGNYKYAVGLNSNFISRLDAIYFTGHLFNLTGINYIFSQYKDADNYILLYTSGSLLFEFVRAGGTTLSRSGSYGSGEIYSIAISYSSTAYVNGLAVDMGGFRAAPPTGACASVIGANDSSGTSTGEEFGLSVLCVSSNSAAVEAWHYDQGFADTGSLLPQAVFPKVAPIDCSSRVAEYTGDGIPQIPDNAAGRTYFQDTWATTDGWEAAPHPSIVLSVENSMLKIAYDGTRPDTGLSFSKNGVAYNNKFVVGKIKSTVPIASVSYYNGIGVNYLNLINTNSYETVFYGYMTSAASTLILYVNLGQLTAKTCWLGSLYIGSGAYDTPAKDRAGNGNNLALTAVTPVDGKYGKEMSFNGVTSFAQASSPVIGTTGTITIRLKPVSLSTNMSPFGNRRGGASGGITGYINATTGLFQFFLVKADGSLQTFDAGNSSVSSFLTFAITWDGTTVKTYREGILIGSTAQAEPYTSPLDNLAIGRMGVYATDYFNGIISHFRYDARIWTADEALAWSLNPMSVDSRV